MWGKSIKYQIHIQFFIKSFGAYVFCFRKVRQDEIKFERVEQWKIAVRAVSLMAVAEKLEFIDKSKFICFVRFLLDARFGGCQKLDLC